MTRNWITSAQWARSVLTHPSGSTENSKLHKRDLREHPLPEKCITKIFAPGKRDPSRPKQSAATVIALAAAAGVWLTSPPTGEGLHDLTGVPVPVPRSEWSELADTEGPDLIGVPIKLATTRKGRAAHPERAWEIIFPLDDDPGVFIFSETRLVELLSTVPCTVQPSQPPDQASLDPPNTPLPASVAPPQHPSPSHQLQPLFPAFPSHAAPSTSYYEALEEGEISPCCSSTTSTGLGSTAADASAPAPGTVPPCLPAHAAPTAGGLRCRIVIYGLGTCASHSPSMILSIFGHFLETHLGLRHLGTVTFIARRQQNFPRPGRHPDLVILEVSHHIQATIWNAKRRLPAWVPVSIDIYRESAAFTAHISSKWQYQHPSKRTACFAIDSPRSVLPLFVAVSPQSIWWNSLAMVPKPYSQPSPPRRAAPPRSYPTRVPRRYRPTRGAPPAPPAAGPSSTAPRLRQLAPAAPPPPPPPPPLPAAGPADDGAGPSGSRRPPQRQ